jgi:hypothetical protein
MDYDNIECWQIVEAFNKREWVGIRCTATTNVKKETVPLRC